MRIYVPWGFIAIFIAFYLFREYNRVSRAKRDERRESLDNVRQQYLQGLINSKKAKEPSKPTTEGDDPGTSAE